jgi:uncharacterized protein YoxC
MSEGTLFNSGFLGADFNWWIGQIAEDSTWRDNILPGKFENKDQIVGWGRRYKVRIIGLHDQESTILPSEQLPWAQVMYPVTAGGGQSGSSATSALRQGNFVFGFFLDGPDQQVPVIMGVLGNNAQTQLGVKTGDKGFVPLTGYNRVDDPNPDPNISVADKNLAITKPKGSEQSQECSPIVSGVTLDKYGLPYGKATKAQLQDIQSASAEANARNLTGNAFDEFVKNAVQNGIKNRCEQANSSTSSARPGATIEQPDNPHQQSVADVKKNDLYHRKVVLMSPCDVTNSALKAMQVVIENLTNDINKKLNALVSYIDAATDILSQIQTLISNAACEIAKYMKTIFDKIMEYVLKKINKAMSPTVSLMYPNQRHRYLDIKEKITQLIYCLYQKITNNLCALIQGILDGELDTKTIPPETSSPTTPICSVESLTGKVISANMDAMNQGIDDVLASINGFLGDIVGELNEVSSVIGSVNELINSISSSLTSALSFQNISISIFGCDITPNCAASSYYTLQIGSGDAKDCQIPKFPNVDYQAQISFKAPKIGNVQFATPSTNVQDVNVQLGC